MSEPTPSLRRLLLALVVAGSGGLLAELLLLEHYETPWQWAPLALLGAVLLNALVVWRHPSPAVIAVFRGAMLACVVAGVAGFVLHYKGNLEFEQERDPTLSGLALVWEVLRGATPALAPGALAQLGLLGLVFSHRHPALQRGASSTQGPT